MTAADRAGPRRPGGRRAPGARHATPLRIPVRPSATLVERRSRPVVADLPGRPLVSATILLPTGCRRRAGRARAVRPCWPPGP